MLLTIDIGNSNLTLGIFEGNNLKTKLFFRTEKQEPISYYSNVLSFLKSEKISGIIISSVADEITDIIRDLVSAFCHVEPFVISSLKNTNLISIKSKTPQNFGFDRIVNAFYAKNMYNLPVIVVDMGTATTFDIVDKEGYFIGGVILPGIETQLKSLSEHTSKLPNIDVTMAKNVKSTINTKTTNAILSGVIKGHAHAIEGLIQDCISELKSSPVIIGTGGLSNIISKYIKANTFTIIDSDFTLKGLKFIYENLKTQKKNH